MESLKKGTAETGVNCFQMPLHYPRYTKEDYLDMPEWKLDQLLSEYGLSAHGDLAYKREYAIGAFLWPDFHRDPKSSSPIYHAMVNNASLLDKKIK